MCGIFGFAGFRDDALLERMGAAVRHRGPDGEGRWCGDGIALGMRRLAIIDLAGGDQPVTNEDGSLVLVYNGEVYNHVELREELRTRGHRFRSRCDTEVVVHAWEEWGEACLERLNGMFAFALWDTRLQELWLARDAAGQKPLYWTRRGHRFLFASEIKALLESEDVERRPNLRAVDAYLGLRYVPQPETLFEGIHVLPAGHTLRLRDGDARIARWWDVPLRSERRARSVREFEEELEALFLDAVRLTLRSDVPVGAYLSGGIDSSLVVAAMAQTHPHVETFSIGFGSPIDETAQARALAERLGCRHHEVVARPEDFARLPQVVRQLERPIGDVLILAYDLLARETSRHVKVVLSGEGADESFAGYSFHKIIQWTEWAHRIFPAFLAERVVAPLVDALPVDLLDKLFVYPAHLGRRGQAKTADYLRHYARRNPNENYVALRALFDWPERRALYAPAFKELATEAWIRPPRLQDGPFLDRLLALQFDDWLQDNLLLRQDKNTMAHSLELRCPFLDPRIIELAFEMPPRLKVRGLADKWIERRLGRRLLPPENVRRSKNPFYFPMEIFHENPVVRDLVRATLDESACASAAGSTRRWCATWWSGCTRASSWS